MKYYLLILLIPFVLGACSSDDDAGGGEPPRGEASVLATAGGIEGLTTVNSILSRDDFATLRNQLTEDEYTLLAPNDAAFERLFATLGVSDPGLIDGGILSAILNYHIIPNQTLQLGQLDSSYITVSRQTVSVNQGDSVRLNANVSAQPTTTIVSPEPLFASNGVVHVIDEVLLPPSIIDIAGNFGTVAGLMDVLLELGLMNNVLEGAQLKSALADETRNFTVIAPAGNFLIDNNINATENGLTFFSITHLIGQTIDIAAPPRKVNNLAGVPLYLSVAGDDAIFINGKPAARVDAQASNGQVLLSGIFDGFGSGVVESPTDVAGGLGAITEATGASFSIFQAALSQTELTLSGEKTLLVPSDSAFIRAGLVASIDSAARIDNAFLTEILNNHIIDGVAFSTDLEAGSLTTLSGNDITLTIAEGRVTLSDSNAESPNASVFSFDEYVFFGDIREVEQITEVGVIHAIDELLLP